MLNDLLAAFGNKKAIRRQVAEKVKKAFDGIDWTKQSFTFNRQKIDVDGEFAFYKAKDIDKAVKSINSMLDDMCS